MTNEALHFKPWDDDSYYCDCCGSRIWDHYQRGFINAILDGVTQEEIAILYAKAVLNGEARAVDINPIIARRWGKEGLHRVQILARWH